MASQELWQRLGPTGVPPSPRSQHVAVVFEHYMYVFGGYCGADPAGQHYVNDIYRLDLNNLAWETLECSGNGPSPRAFHSGIHVDGSLYILYGQSFAQGYVYFDDIFELNLRTRVWTEVTYTGSAPSARSAQSCVLRGDKIYVFGGQMLSGGFTYYNDFYEYNLSQRHWNRIADSGTMPPRRSMATSFVYGSNVFIFGGEVFNGTWTYFNDLYQFDFETSNWSLVITRGVPPSPRCVQASVMVSENDSFILFGGVFYTGRSTYFDDVQKLDLTTKYWRRVETQPHTGSPCARSQHSLVRYGDSAYLFAGYTYSVTVGGRCFFNDVYRMDLSLATARKSRPVTEKLSDGKLSSDAVGTDLRALLDNEVFSDVAFVAEGRRLHAHRCILYARSSHFSAMFDPSHGFKETMEREIAVPEKYQTFAGILEFIYAGSIREFAPDLALDLLVAADKYSLGPLAKKCEEELKKHLCIENVAEMLDTADRLSASDLKQFCLRYVRSNFQETLKMEGFLDMRKDLLREVLASVYDFSKSP